jgi:oligopeptide/dipeptide ABC transporter ATP-binding protein
MERAMNSAAQPLLEVRDLCVRFPRGSSFIRAVDGLSYRLLAGQALAIIGESGSGKSVSCRALMGLLSRSAVVEGSILFDGTQLLGLPERKLRSVRGSGISMVFQDSARSLNPTMRVGDQITEAIRLREPMDREQADRRGIELLEMLRMPAARQRFGAYPHELSGGMRQRVMIAIAIARRPKLLIADEATRSLDPITQAETLKLLRSLQQHLRMAVIMVSHDLRLAASIADDALVLYAGRAVESAASHRLFEQPRMQYTRALLDAMPGLERKRQPTFPPVRESPPDPRSLATGCPFEPRCASAQSLCRRSQPHLEEGEPGHWWACWNPSHSTTRA